MVPAGGVYGTALQAASFEGHQEIATMLLEKGANPNVQGMSSAMLRMYNQHGTCRQQV
jgi:ankyrin repeat protein